MKELDYHHRGDNEEEFFNNWKTSKNTFGLIESNEITVVVPFIDVDMLINYHKKGFASLEQFYDYWQKAVNRMDYIIGLELNPDNPVHQNVPARYVIKANRNGAGAAYYSGNHVGVNSEHVYSFFEMNWGGLHEFAHGYQGSLGKGVMGLGEVSNNIIGHYIQKNKDIYFHEGNWLGDFTKREVEFNSPRLEGKTWDSLSVDKRLYMICNLLDHFKGEDTYRDIFRWYREQLNAGRTLTNTDAYVEAIAELEGVNIIPYMQAWGLTVGEETRNKVYNSRLPLLTILGDMLSEDTLPSIMAENQITEKFEPVENDVLKAVSTRVNLTFAINDFESIRNKKLVVADGKEVIKEVTVTEETVSLELPVGTYTLYAPISNLASNNAEYLMVKEGENEAAVTYSDFSEHKYNTSVVFGVQGIHGTYGYKLSFNEDYTRATATLNGSDMGSTEPYVKIYRADGTLVEEETVTRTNNEYYFDFARKTYDVEFQPGDYIEIYHPNYANRVTVHSNLNGSRIAAFTPVSALTKYTIVQGGIVMNEMTKEEAVEINYELLKTELTKLIEDYRDGVSEEELADVSANRPMKNKVLTAYLNLHTEERTEYTEFVEKLKEKDVENGVEGTEEASGILYVTTPGTARIAAGYNIEEFLYESVAAYDNNFNKIQLTKDNITISTQLDVETPGTYTVDYTVTAEGASGTGTLTVVVNED